MGSVFSPTWELLGAGTAEDWDPSWTSKERGEQSGAGGGQGLEVQIHNDLELSEGLPRETQVIADGPGVSEKAQSYLISATQHNTGESNVAVLSQVGVWSPLRHLQPGEHSPITEYRWNRTRCDQEPAEPNPRNLDTEDSRGTLRSLQGFHPSRRLRVLQCYLPAQGLENGTNEPLNSFWAAFFYSVS